MKYPYFNPYRAEHVILMKRMEGKIDKLKKHSIEMVPYGDRTQHIFIDKKYYMTLNWSLI